MVSDPTQEITVDRVSNNGNPIAKERHNGKTIHVPSGLEGESYEVRLQDKGSYIVAHLVHKEAGARVQTTSSPSGPSGGKDVILELGEKLIGDETMTIEQRECSDNRLNAAEYPGKDHRSEIASRHD